MVYEKHYTNRITQYSEIELCFTVQGGGGGEGTLLGNQTKRQKLYIDL